MSAFTPSANIARLRESATIAVSARAREMRAAGRAVIDLGAGEPDFDTPEFIRRAAQRAIDAGATRYTAVGGMLLLREAIADHANAQLASASLAAADPVRPGDVVVGTGAKQALFNTIFSLFGPGDEVLVPTPGWTSYYDMLELARARAVPVPGDPGRGLKVRPDDLAQWATERTAGLIINSPSNPTGAVYERDELAALLTMAEERGWWVISDEIYRGITYGTEAPSALDIARSRERLVVIDGCSKRYAMTGWRIGWAIAPSTVARSMCAVQSHTTSNPAAPSQYAALAALTETGPAARATQVMTARFQARRHSVLGMLEGAGEPGFVTPQGAFYILLDVAGVAPSGEDAALAFCEHLLGEHGVAAVPGGAFMAPRWVRLSFAAPDAEVTEGVRRVVTAYAELRAGRSKSAPAPSGQRAATTRG